MLGSREVSRERRSKSLLFAEPVLSLPSGREIAALIAGVDCLSIRPCEPEGNGYCWRETVDQFIIELVKRHVLDTIAVCDISNDKVILHENELKERLAHLAWFAAQTLQGSEHGEAHTVSAVAHGITPSVIYALTAWGEQGANTQQPQKRPFFRWYVGSVIGRLEHLSEKVAMVGRFDTHATYEMLDAFFTEDQTFAQRFGLKRNARRK